MNGLSDGDSTQGAGSDRDEEGDAYLGAVLGSHRLTALVSAAPKVRVYDAREVKSGAAARVKVLLPEIEASGPLAEQYVEDAHAAGTWGLPNIARSIEAGIAADGALYHVTEAFPNGRTLEAVLESGEPFAAPRAVAIAAQLATAIEGAHSRGLVHGFLNPTSVILVPQGGDQPELVKVLDFGVALFNGAKSYGLGRFLGPPNCMAPEQMLGPQGTDSRSDVYALGALLYAMLAGRVPFAKMAAANLPRAIVEMEPTKLRTVRPELRVSLIQVVNRAMRKAREDRFVTVQEFQTALARADAVLPTGPVAGEVAPVSVQAMPTPVEVAKAEPVKAEPVKVEPVKAEPVKAEPAKLSETKIAAVAPPAAEPKVEAKAEPTRAPVSSPMAFAQTMVAPSEVAPPAASAADNAAPAPSAAPPAALAATFVASSEVVAPATSARPVDHGEVAASAVAPERAVARAVASMPPAEEKEKKKGAAIFIVPAVLAAAVVGFLVLRPSGTPSTTTQSTPPVATLAAPPTTVATNAAKPTETAVPAKPTPAPPTTVANIVPDNPPARVSPPTEPPPRRDAPRVVYAAKTPSVTKTTAAPAPVAPTPATAVAAAPSAAPAVAATPAPTSRKPRTSAELEPEEYYEDYSNAKAK